MRAPRLRTRVVLGAVLLLAAGTVSAGVADASVGPCAGATVVGTDGDDRLVGTPGPDVVDGRGGDDRIDGLGGDDILCGGEGRDRLSGGAGQDLLLGGTDAKVVEDTEYYVYYGDTLDGGAGDDLLVPGLDPRHEGSVDTVSWAGASQGVTVDLGAGTASGDGEDRLAGPFATAVGSSYDDTMRGGDGDDVLRGGDGRDRLEGRGGADDLGGGDRQRAGARPSPNVLLGGPGGDILDGGDGPDVLRGGDGNDLLQGNGGADRSFGGAGDDTVNDVVAPVPGQVVDGGPGRHDDLVGLFFGDADGGRPGRVTGRLDLAAGTAVARLPRRTVRLAAPGFENATSPGAPGDRWTIIGTDGPNVLLAGWRSAVEIHAGAGDDRLWGEVRDDLLDGGPGLDFGDGVSGRDRYRSIERGRR